MPPNRSQEKRWSREVRARLPEWVRAAVVPLFERAIDEGGLRAHIRREEDRLFIDYEALATGSGYVGSSVMLEFGARSTGEPAETRRVTCDAAMHLPDLLFPEAVSRVMRAERTFWEKATARMSIACRVEAGGSVLLGIGMTLSVSTIAATPMRR